MIYKKYIITFSIILISGLHFSCQIDSKDNRQNKAEPHKSDSRESNQKAIIKVVSDDAKALKHTAITDFNKMSNTGAFYSKIIQNDTLTFTIDSIYKPHILRYSGIGNYNSYRAKILVSPGDKVLFKIKNNFLVFIGKNAANYNFYTQLDSTGTDWSKIPYNGDIFEYKKKCKANYLKRQHFLESYVAQNNVSDDFKAFVGAELQQEYLWNLMGPRSIPSKDGLFFINNLENLIGTIAQDYDVEKDGVFNLEEYFDHIGLQDFNNSEQLNSFYGRYNLISFLRQYFLGSEYTTYSKSKFQEEKKFIQENFIDDVETYAIARLLVDYHKNSFGLVKESNDLLKQTIDTYYERFSKDDSYKEKIDELKQSLNNIDSKLSDELLQTKLIDFKGDTISLNEVFNKSKNKIKVIDFWASWCLPCIDEVQKSQNIRNTLVKNDNLDLIYFSIDKDKSSWIKSSKKMAKYGMLKNQYLIPNFKSTELNQFLRVKSIPRYVIFNKQNEIVVEDGPRPTDSIRFKGVLNEVLMKR